MDISTLSQGMTILVPLVTGLGLWFTMRADQKQAHKEREELKANTNEHAREMKEFRLMYEQRLATIEKEVAVLNEEMKADNSRHDQMLFFAKEFADKMANGFKEAILSLKS